MIKKISVAMAVIIKTIVYKAAGIPLYLVGCDGEMESDTLVPIAYNNYFIYAIHLENGKIIEYEEYFNPIKLGDFLKNFFTQLSKAAE